MMWVDVASAALVLALFASTVFFLCLKLFGGTKEQCERREYAFHLFLLTLVTTSIGAYCLLEGFGVLGDGLTWPPPHGGMVLFGLTCLLVGLVAGTSFRKPAEQPGASRPGAGASSGSASPGSDDPGPRGDLLRYFAFVETAAFGDARSLGVPVATIPMRLVIDFTYTPDEPAFLAAFSAEEQADLAAYDRLLQLAIEVLDRGGPDLLIQDLMDATEWVRTADFARVILGRWPKSVPTHGATSHRSTHHQPSSQP